MDTLIWLVPAAVLACGIRSPRGGLLAFVACLPLFGSPPGGPYLAAFDVAALLAVATAWRAGPAPRSRLDWSVWAFLGVTAASLLPLAYQPPSWSPRILARLVAALPGVEPWTPLFGWRAFASLLIGLGLYLAVRRAFADRGVRPLFLALAGGLGAALLLGLGSHADLIDLEFFRVKGGPTWETRLHSLFFHSGWFAEFVVLAAPLSVGALAGFGRRGRAAASLVALLVIPTIVLTEQRGAWFALAGQIVVAAALWGGSIVRWRRGWRTLAAGAVLATTLLGVAVIAQPDLFESAVERSRKAFTLANRTFIWEVATEISAERPLLGWGVGSFSPAYLEKMGSPPAGPFDWLTAHSQYLMVSAERGLLGLGAFALLCWGLLRVTIGASRGGAGGQVLARCLLVSFAGLLIYGVVQYMFFLRTIEWLFWVLAGATATLAPQTNRDAHGRPAPAVTDRLAQVVLILAAVLVPWRLFAVEPLAAAGNRAFGLHRAEESDVRSFQWSTGYAAWQQQRPDGSFELTLANGHPRPDRHRVRVVVRVDGREALNAEIAGEWRAYPIDLGPETSDSMLVEIEARPAFRPWRDYRKHPELEGSIDIRELGVAISPPPSGAPASRSPGS